jgi:hypothetical protein
MSFLLKTEMQTESATPSKPVMIYQARNTSIEGVKAYNDATLSVRAGNIVWGWVVRHYYTPKVGEYLVFTEEISGEIFKFLLEGAFCFEL